MAGVGEASAIIGLVSTAAKLSKAVFEIGLQYTEAKAQIESFGREISILGKILDQLSRFISNGTSHIDIGVHLLTTEIIDECSNMFSQLDAYNEKLYGNPAGLNPSLRAKTKWVFQTAELDYFRTRVDSMKINLLLMMSFQSISALSGSSSLTNLRTEEHARRIQMLSTQSDACVKRLQNLEENSALSVDYNDDAMDPAASVKSFDSFNTAQTTRESILSLYESTPYANNLWSTSESIVSTTDEAEDSQAKALKIVEDYLDQLDDPRNEMSQKHDDVLERSRLEEDSGLLETDVKCVLSLDGGGIRTYSSILILQSLMVQVAYVESNMASDAMESSSQPLDVLELKASQAFAPVGSLTFHPCRNFDYIGGASSGGLLAIMLGRLRMSVHDCLSEYRQIAESLFGNPRFASTKSALYWPQPKYDHHPFESQFESLLRRYDKTFSGVKPQESLLESDFNRGKTIAVSWLRNLQSGTGQPFLFRSYNEPRLNGHNPLWPSSNQTPLCDISRALISSPKYLSPLKVKGHEFIGYKKELHNPSMVILQEVLKNVDATSNVDICFVSIGSGIYGCSIADAFSPSSGTDPSSPQIAAQKSTKIKRYAYYRLNPGHMLGNIKFDDWQKSKGSGEEVTINRITRATKEYLSDDTVQKTLRTIAEVLVRKRRASSEKANLKRWG
ncbi:hypothetical protein MMC07_000209 [Pseudocyphellaria aurata]|nr:hypothetical protein [Pseudocyphellaria aurata]